MVGAASRAAAVVRGAAAHSPPVDGVTSGPADIRMPSPCHHAHVCRSPWSLIRSKERLDRIQELRWTHRTLPEHVKVGSSEAVVLLGRWRRIHAGIPSTCCKGQVLQRGVWQPMAVRMSNRTLATVADTCTFRSHLAQHACTRSYPLFVCPPPHSRRPTCRRWSCSTLGSTTSCSAGTCAGAGRNGRHQGQQVGAGAAGAATWLDRKVHLGRRCFWPGASLAGSYTNLSL